MKAYLLTVGDEILIGQIVDTNAAWMARELNLQGHIVIQKSSVGDLHEEITKALAYAESMADLVLVTGGLGATKDDITKKTIADYFGVEMVFHQETYDRMEYFFKRLGREVSEMNRKGCYMPANAAILTNKVGLAPGMWFENNGKILVSMPGVPFEMQYLMEHEVLPRLKARSQSTPIVHRTILTAGEGETRLAEIIADFEHHLPAHVKLAFLPALGMVRLRLTATGPDETALNALLDEKVLELRQIIEPIIVGFEEETLPSVVGKLLKERGLMMGTAESCTGGYIAHLITSIPGSSEYYQGSVISYSNEIKMRLLNVDAKTLENQGAVSEETVREMVRGALQKLQTDVVVAVSGIAGPDGGTPDKPVGTIWMAVGNREGVQTAKLQLFRDRVKNIEYTGYAALNLVRKFLLAH